MKKFTLLHYVIHIVRTVQINSDCLSAFSPYINPPVFQEPAIYGFMVTCYHESGAEKKSCIQKIFVFPFLK